MSGYLSAGPNRAIVNIGAVDTENRLASGTFSDGSECGNIINTRNHVGAVQVTPAVGEQWVVEKGSDQLWVLITKLPIHTPDLAGDTKPSAGQVQIGSSGPLELFGSTINAHADINAANITIPEGNKLILNGVHMRMSDSVLQVSSDGTTWEPLQPPLPPIPLTTDDLPEGDDNLYFTEDRVTALAPVRSVNTLTGDVVITKDLIGLGNVSNLTPLDLPLSTAATSALGSKADLIAGTVPDIQLPQLATSKITGLDTQLTGITGSSGLQGIFDIFKGTSGGALGDITSRISQLNPLTGLLNAAGLTNTSNLPVLNQDRVTGLPGIVSLVTGGNGIQAILDAFKGTTGGGVTDIIGRIINLGTGGLFDSAGLTNTSNLPVLNQDRVTGLPGIISLVSGTNGIQAILDAFKGTTGGGVTDIVSRIVNLGTGGLFNAAFLNNTSNLPVLNQDRITGLPGIISLVTGSNGLQAILDAFKGTTGGGVTDIVARIVNLGTGGLFNAAFLNNTSNLPVLNQDRVTGLPGLFTNVTGLGTNVTGILDAFKGTTGGLVADVISRIQYLASGTGLFDAASLTNTSSIPVLNQDRITGLPGIITLVTGSNGIQAILDAIKGGGGGTSSDIVTRLASLLPFSIFNQRQVSGSNLVISPDFEDTSISRADYGGPGSGYSTEQSRSGTHSFKLVSTASYNGAFAMPTADYQQMRIQAGQKFYLEIWVRGKTGNTAGGTISFNFRCDDSKGVNATAYPGFSIPAPLVGAGWTKLSGYVTIPTGYDLAVPFFQDDDTVPSGAEYYFDDVLVREETASKNIIDTLGNTLNQTTGQDFSLLTLATAFTDIPNIFLAGYGGPGNAAATWQATWDQIIGGSVGAAGTGTSLADLFNIFFQISTNAAQGPMAFNLFGGLNNTRAMWRGRLPSSDVTLPIQQMMFAKNTSGVPVAPTFAITQAAGAHTTWHIIQQDASKGVVQWRGQLVGGTNTDFRARLLKMDPATGTVTPQQVSGNLLGSLGTTTPPDYTTWTLTTPMDVLAGDIIGVELQLIGTGTYNVLGDQTWDSVNHPTIFPRRLSSIRSGSGSTVTLGGSYAHLTGFAYTDKVAAIEFAVNSGNPPAPHGPDLRTFNVVGTSSIPIPDWCNTVQIIVIPGGGKGFAGSSTPGIVGEGGGAGTIGTLILTRTTHFTSGATVNYTVGGGSTGSNGGTSSATVGANTVSRTGGVDGGGWTTGSNMYGDSPGTTTVDSVPYQGGAQQTSAGSAGNPYGGGGAGGGYNFGLPGGNGAAGVVWVRFKQ